MKVFTSTVLAFLLGAFLLSTSASSFGSGLHERQVSVTFAPLPGAFSPARARASESLALGDIDLDGDLDAIVVNAGQGMDELNEVWLNNGCGRFDFHQSFGEPIVSAFGAMSHDVRLNDIDQDGDLDVVVANTGDEPEDNSRIWLNERSICGQHFCYARSIGFDPADHRGVALGDFDLDGDTDVLLGPYSPLPGQGSELYQNDAGVFLPQTPPALSASGGAVQGVAAGDLNCDGRPDAFLARGAQPGANRENRVHLNDTSVIGTVSLATALGEGVAPDPVVSQQVALADLDNDGDLDAVTADRQSASHYYENLGCAGWVTGWNFAPRVALQTLGGDAYGVAIADVDANGYADVVLAKSVSGGGVENVVLANRGAVGGFDQVLLPASEDSRGVGLGDLDNDGDVDIVFANRGQNTVWLNQRNAPWNSACQ